MSGITSELVLRKLQQLDEVVHLGEYRYLLIEAETLLGEELDLECTGAVDGTNEDGSPAYYEHNSETCPIHEWVCEDDWREITGKEES